MLCIAISKSLSLFEISMVAINIRHELATVLAILRRRRRRRQKAKAKTKSRFSISPLNVERSLLGTCNSTFLLAPERFDNLLSLIRPKITKINEKEYKVRTPISAEGRLAVTLRYLASGDSK